MADREGTGDDPRPQASVDSADAANLPPVVVMKFGGTSVATADGRRALARRVAAALEMSVAPVIVVSAMGRAGEAYATDTLLGLVEGLPTDDRERDLLATTGELIASVVVAHELRAGGVDAVAFSGVEAGIVTDGVQGEATIVSIHPVRLIEALRARRVPVVAGFQGLSEDGRLTALGRGGSDTTACALGIALQAESVEIYTDVDGVMTADPRACTGVTPLPTLGADELYHLAEAGSKVVHVSAAKLALSSGLTLSIKNTFTDEAGTTVTDMGAYRPTGVATAISRIDGVVRIEVALPEAEGTLGHMRAQTRVYRAMADAGISLDMFTPAGDKLLFTLSASALAAARRAIEDLGLSYRASEHLSKVTVVGAGMHGVPGVMARVATYLDERGVPILQAADSHTTISVLVTEDDAAAAVQALHDGFELGERRDGLA